MPTKFGMNSKVVTEVDLKFDTLITETANKKTPTSYLPIYLHHRRKICCYLPAVIQVFKFTFLIKRGNKIKIF